MPAPDIDAMLFSPEYVASPYRTYHLLRSQHPAYWSGFPNSGWCRATPQCGKRVWCSGDWNDSHSTCKERDRL